METAIAIFLLISGFLVATVIIGSIKELFRNTMQKIWDKQNKEGK